MSYERSHEKTAAALKNILHSYGAPLGMLLFIVLAALYITVSGRGAGGRDFPRLGAPAPDQASAELRLGELRKRLDENPSDIRALEESGRLKFQLGPSHYVDAISDLENARSFGLADPRSFYYLGVMYQAVGLYEFSAQEYRRFLNNYPGDAEVRMLLAKLYFASGDFPGAVREYEALKRDGSKDPVLFENLALALWKSGGDYGPVLAELRAAGGQGSFLADYAEGRISYEQKDYAAALPRLASAASGEPSAGAFSDSESLFWMAGDAASRVKDLGAAARYLGELLKVNPSHEEGKRLLAKVEKAAAAEAKAAEKAAAAAAKAAEKAAKAAAKTSAKR
ncbi:MAG: hypothetical protein M0025_08035 [Elusimicrobia bacterium]|nr:hypothetical protein [Elusimicrobiota bacterium]